MQKRKQGQRLTPYEKANVIEKLNQWLSNPDINKPSRNQLAKELGVSSKLLGTLIAEPIDNTPSKQALSGSTRRLLAEVLQLVDISGLPTTLSYMTPRHSAFSKLTKNAYGMFKREALERREQDQVTVPMPPTQEGVQKLEMVVSPLHFVTQDQENSNSSIWLVLLRPSGVLLHYVIRGDDDDDAFGNFIIDVVMLFDSVAIHKVTFLTGENNKFPEYPSEVKKRAHISLQDSKVTLKNTCIDHNNLLENRKIPSIDFKKNPYNYAKKVIHLPLEGSTIKKSYLILESLCKSYNSNEFMKCNGGWTTDKNRSPCDSLKQFITSRTQFKIQNTHKNKSIAPEADPESPDHKKISKYWAKLSSVMHRPIPNSRLRQNEMEMEMEMEI